jgi:hypothetical protein
MSLRGGRRVPAAAQFSMSSGDLETMVQDKIQR